MSSSGNVPKNFSDCCSKVLNYLYIGDKFAAKSLDLLEKLGITSIINVSPKRESGGIHNFFESDARFSYLRCPCIDSDDEVISIYFPSCIKFIENARAKGHSCLVHCQLGRSRSASIILAFMISLEEWNLKNAYCHLKAIRKCVKPKSNFLRQLIHFEKHSLLDGKSHPSRSQSLDVNENENENKNMNDSSLVINNQKKTNKSRKRTSMDINFDSNSNVVIENDQIDIHPPIKKRKLLKCNAHGKHSENENNI